MEGKVLFPVIVSEFGEGLMPYPRRDNSNSDPGEYPDSSLSTCVGIHHLCGGWIDIRRASESHNALCCLSCKMRILIPVAVDTFGKLAKYFADYNGPIPSKLELLHEMSGPQAD